MVDHPSDSEAEDQPSFIPCRGRKGRPCVNKAKEGEEYCGVCLRHEQLADRRRVRDALEKEQRLAVATLLKERLEKQLAQGRKKIQALTKAKRADDRQEQRRAARQDAPMPPAAPAGPDPQLLALLQQRFPQGATLAQVRTTLEVGADVSDELVRAAMTRARVPILG